MVTDLSHRDEKSIFSPVDLQDGSSIVANLTTIGRKTGRRRTVELRFLYFKGKFYATSNQVASKHWCQNMLKNPAVEITAKGEIISCTAALVIDDAFRKQILVLRDSPPQLQRVVFEIAPKIHN